MKKICLLALALSLPLEAAPVKSADFYVTPYYSAEGGRVKALGGIDEPLLGLLASGRTADMAAAQKYVEENSATVPTVALMMLAARLYDVGQRDEAVFWFYVAKDRYSLFMRVIDTGGGALREEELALVSFRELLGPYLNSYAFCDPARQQRLRARALQWVRQHPQAALQDPQLKARGPNRAALAAAALKEIQASADRESQFVKNPEEMKKFQERRRANRVDEQFCWK